MKIYFDIEGPADQLDLVAFCKNRGIDSSVAEYVGVYCLDNTAKVLGYPSSDEVNQVPDSFIFTWDSKHIGDLYDNKIIGRFNQGKMQWTMMDFKSMEPMIQVLMYGAKKYDRDNWKKACPKKLDLLDSLERHFVGLVAGESVDQESGLPHIGHLMCNAMFYSYWEQKTNGLFENFVGEPTK